MDLQELFRLVRQMVEYARRQVELDPGMTHEELRRRLIDQFEAEVVAEVVASSGARRS